MPLLISLKIVVSQNLIPFPPPHLDNTQLLKKIKIVFLEHASPEQIVIFIHESSLLKRTNHPNVLTLMHVCVDDNNIPLMVYPYTNRGNLKNYLRLSRTAEPLAKVGWCYTEKLFVH